MTGKKSDISGTGPLIWMDMEMSGLDPEKDVILEIATIITDKDLIVLEEGPNLVIHHDQSFFDTMDPWCKEHHTKSGLWEKVVSSTTSLVAAEEETLKFIKNHVDAKKSPLCGNSIWQDRRFIRRYMKKLDAHLHYRLVDVSTVKELAGRWYDASVMAFEKSKDLHRALDDVRESIAELRFYREKIFK